MNWPRRLLPLACFALAACSGPEPSTPALGGWSRAAPAIPLPRTERAPSLPPARAVPQTRFAPQAIDADPTAQRLNASTPEALVESLQVAERQLSPEDLNLLKGAMTLIGADLERQVKRLMANGGNRRPDPSELYAMAFGRLHGMTVAETIALGHSLAREYVDSRRSSPVGG